MSGVVPAGPQARLPDGEIAAIKAAVAQVFGPEARVRLFGSRTRLDRVGGDEDLLVHVPAGMEDLRLELRLACLLDEATEGRQVDIVLLADDRAPTEFEQIALRDGVLL